jgi:hypothetical protein
MRFLGAALAPRKGRGELRDKPPTVRWSGADRNRPFRPVTTCGRGTRA